MRIARLARYIEPLLFGFVIMMLSYAWLAHFYGVVLYNPNEFFEHAFFWTAFYPISIFLVSAFFTRRFGFSLVVPLAFLISGVVLFFSMWFLFYPFFFNNRVIFWSLLTCILILLVLMRLVVGKFRSDEPQ